MAKENSSRTIWIIIAVVVGVLLIGGLIIGFGCYSLYKIGTSSTTSSPSPSVTTVDTTGWKYYNNARYGFTLNYPNTLSDQESVNGDGVTLTSSSPAVTISASAVANSQNQTLDEYLNATRADLFKGVDGAEEILAQETTTNGVLEQERQWQYKNPVDGTLTVMDQVTALKGNNFYTVKMVVAYADFAKYSPIFDQIIKSFNFV